MEKINEQKQITATYEDALRYLDNDISANVKRAMEEAKGASADELMFGIIESSLRMDAAMAAIAFCYGVSEQQVRDDLMKLKDGE